MRPRQLASWGLMLLVAAMCGGVRPRPVPDALPGAGTISEQGVITVDWKLLRGLDYRSGKMSDTLKALDGKRVRVPGFIVPLDDLQDRAKEFLLVPYFGACVHLPPPPPNQIVYATLRSMATLALFDPVWVIGTLRVENYKSPYGVAGYRIEAEKFSKYEDMTR
ncbi:DUF3299 domain-containing protein [Gemmatimonas sp.]|uniref:DUF3299 domain-containing protein n=1 Tax=Gemmatimonas sp. TaxID=1962908 RepID=UPI0037C160DE